MALETPLLTYTYDRGTSAVTLTGSPPLETGQWAGRPSRGIRSSGSHRAQLTHGDRITPTSGAAVIFLDPDNASGAGGQAANGRILSWRTDANNCIEVEYTKGSTVLTVRRLNGGAGATATTALTFTAGQALAVYIAWDAANVYVAADGGAIASAANSQNPTLPATLDIGSVTGSATYFDAGYAEVLLLPEPLSADEWQYLAASRATRPPGAYELAPGNAAVWTVQRWLGCLPTAEHGTVFGLHDPGANYEVSLRGLRGAGMPTVRLEMDESPFRDGSVFNGALLGERVMVADIDLHAVTGWARMQELRAALLGALNPANGIGLLTWVPSTTAYIIEAVYDSGGGLDEQFIDRFHKASLVLRCPDPAWRLASPSVVRFSGARGGLTIPLVIPLVIVANSINTVASNVGPATLPARPSFRVYGPLVGPSLINSTTGKRCDFSTDVASGDILTVDMDMLTAKIADGTSKMGDRGDVSEFWQLERGANSVTVDYQSSTDATVTVDLQYDTRMVGV